MYYPLHTNRNRMEKIMKKFWEIYISVNDEEYYMSLRVQAEKVRNKGFDEKTERYVLQVDKQMLYFDEHIVEIKEIKKI